MLINNLNEIKLCSTKQQYKYKNIEFLTNFQKADTIVIMFHGGRCGAPLPIFRGYDYYFENTNVISISDPLLEIYPNINIGWYFDSQKCIITNNVVEILKYIKQKSNVDRMLFVAQCAGALFAIKLGCILNEYVLITNPHLILKAKDIEFVYSHWTDESINSGFRMPLTDDEIKFGKRVMILNQALINNSDYLQNKDELDVRQIINKYGIPKKIIAYTHQNDYTVQWLDLLYKFLTTKNYNLENFIYKKHDTKCKSPHHCPLPPQLTLKELIANYEYNVV